MSENAIIKLGPANVESYELILRPRQIFISSSASGVTQGYVKVFPDGSSIEKDVVTPGSFPKTKFDESGVEEYRKQLADRVNRNVDKHKRGIRGKPPSFGSSLQLYMDAVNAHTASAPRNKQVEIMRFTPTFKFTSNTLRKNIVRETLSHYYRTTYPDLGWNVTNYNCLNFFTSSQTPTRHCLMYPASASVGTSIYPYRPKDAFTFEFWVNPKYTVESSGKYKPGTIMHMSSCYAITLHTGTNANEKGQISRFRIALQLSHSADIPPSHLKFGKTGIQNVTASRHSVGKDDIVFVSTPSLKLNHWHHVVMRWGNKSFNAGSGSIIIDGKIDGSFVIPLSSSIMPTKFKAGVTSDPDSLIIGNYFEGKNIGNTMLAKWFNDKSHAAHGVGSEFPGSVLPFKPEGSFFHHPLNAEIHELRIWNQYRTLNQVRSGSTSGLTNLASKNNSKLMFYVPPFFQKQSPKRNVLQTPFQVHKTTTDDPFNTAMSFGVGGKIINIQNYTRDFVKGVYPLPVSLTASQILGSTKAYPANEFFARNHEWNAGSLLLQPCDNGLFKPAFSLLASGTVTDHPTSGSNHDRFIDEFGNLDFSLIGLHQLLTSASLPSIDGRSGPFTSDGTSDAGARMSGSMTEELQGANPEDPGRAQGSTLTILNRTRDFSSNEIVFYDISNLYYGSKIEPDSFLIIDESITGSGGKVSMKLRDNGIGSLYRADAETKHATWNKVGNIFYDEGIVTILSPNIQFFGKHQTKVYFNGIKRIFVKEVNIPVPAGMINSSSNPEWKKMPPSSAASENADKFVYVSTVNLHDQNMNVVARANLAQPFIKRDEEEFLVRLKLDF